MDIKPYSQYDETQILPLYRAVGWSNYYNRPEMLKQAFAGSLCTLAAWENGRLIGLIRAVGDGYSSVLIQDILVYPEYQRRGIGTALMREMLARYAHVYQIQLATDNTEKTKAFYRSQGFRPMEELGCCGFMKI
ncbi:MAG: GNAT family N-acetyltransferase [Ruminococcaceae bacterium]|nr:GNAT family N-acetyltransferase [Oscillospiraceae bacterium]